KGQSCVPGNFRFQPIGRMTCISQCSEVDLTARGKYTKVLCKNIGCTLASPRTDAEGSGTSRSITKYGTWGGEPSIKIVMVLAQAQNGIKAFGWCKSIFYKSTSHPFITVKIVAGHIFFILIVRYR